MAVKGHGAQHILCESCTFRRRGKLALACGEPIEWVKVHDPAACCDCGAIVQVYEWWTSQPDAKGFKACGVMP